MNEKKEKKRGGLKRILLIIFLVILTLILIATAIVVLYLNHLLDRITTYDPANDVTISYNEVEEILTTDPEYVPIDPSTDESIPDISDIAIPTDPPEVTEPVDQGEDVVNILLIGQDRRGSKGRARSDSMILLTFNKDAATITLTSFMRDSYVQIPGYKPNKMNHAYQYGGMSLLNETMKVNFGVEVDGNVEVDFSSFQKIIDLMDGVDISLTEKEATYLRDGGGWDVTVGTNRLTGEQALAYSRLREIDSDYRRAERQRKVLMSLIERYKSQSLTEMLGMLEEILPLVTTNMDKGEIIGYATELFPMLTSAEFNTMRIPADGTFKQGNVKVREGLKNWFQYNIDFEANREILREIFDDD